MNLSEKIDELKKAMKTMKGPSKDGSKKPSFGPGKDGPGPSKQPQSQAPMGGTRANVKFTGKKNSKKR